MIHNKGNPWLHHVSVHNAYPSIFETKFQLCGDVMHGQGGSVMYSGVQFQPLFHYGDGRVHCNRYDVKYSPCSNLIVPMYKGDGLPMP